MYFKLDTGAAVTAIQDSMYSKATHGDLQSGPSNTPLQVTGQVGLIEKSGKKVKQDIYVVPGLVAPLLGLPAIQSLQLLKQIHSIQDTATHFRGQYPEVFTGLSKLQGEYKRVSTAICPVISKESPITLDGESKRRT